jgi:deoxyribonuclease IV
MRYGCHISTKNGYLGAAKVAKAIGARSFQYFPKNPRSLKTKEFNVKDAENCASYCAEHDITSIGHSAYACNFSADEGKRELVEDCILNDLEITDACGSIGTVVHFGSYHGEEPLEGYKRMIDTLNDILSKWEGKSLILIENNAGKGDQMGLTLEEQVKIRGLTAYPEKIGFCFDTCHAFASGLWQGNNWNEVMEKGEELGYFDHLKAVHLNNSVYPSGSRHDRHANIKSGEIPLEDMITFMTSHSIKDLPLILETPSSTGYTHQQEIRDLKKWVEQ